MDEAGTATVDATGEKRHTERFVVGDALKSSDQVCALEIL